MAASWRTGVAAAVDPSWLAVVVAGPFGAVVDRLVEDDAVAGVVHDDCCLSAASCLEKAVAVTSCLREDSAVACSVVVPCPFDSASCLFSFKSIFSFI